MKRLAVLGVLLATSGVAAAWPWTGRWVSIVEPARVTGFAPLKGPPGTKVVLEGSGFLPGDIVSVGGAPVKAAIQPTRIELTIPKGAASGELAITRGSSRPLLVQPAFELLPAAPVRSTFVPSAGPPGTVVTLTLAETSATDRVSYGKTALIVRERTPTTLKVQVPTDASTGELFSIDNPSGRAVAGGPFTLVLPATITGFDPPRGLPGVTVTVTGANFQAGDELWLGTRPLEIQRLSAKGIVATLPKNAVTAKFQHRRGKTVVDFATAFVVLAPPRLLDFAPASGPATTRVTLTGTGFTEATKVTYGDRTLKVLARSGDTSITVMIPPDIGDATFTLTTEAGTTKHPRPFKVVAK